MNNQHTAKVWDPFIRVFHWALVAAFALAYVTEDELLTIHNWAGYTVLGLVLARIIWGLIGTQHARFSDFVFTPTKVLQYLKDTLRLQGKRYLGHNPAGGAMVVLLLVSLLITTLTGIAVLGIEEAAGPLAHWATLFEHEQAEWLEEVHEFFANFSVFLVFVHVAGVLVESLIHRENLVSSMFNGKKAIRKDDTV